MFSQLIIVLNSASTYTAFPFALSFKYLRKRAKKLSISVSKSYDTGISFDSSTFKMRAYLLLLRILDAISKVV
jgi:hypothetical protein